MKSSLHLVRLRNENRSVGEKGLIGARILPTRPPNAELRPREYLTPAEVEKLIKAARSGRWGHRDATLILIAYRHGLRAAELVALEWSQVELSKNAALHVRRVKNGKPAVHPLRGDEIRALRELQRSAQGPYVFETERGGPFTTDSVNQQVKRIALAADSRRGTSTCTCSGTLAATRWPMPARHAGDPRLARPSIDTAYVPVHGAGADQVQGFLAMSEITLELLGKRMLALQAEMRTVRSENASLRLEAATAMANAITTITTTMSDRIAAFEALIEGRLDHIEARFDQTERSIEERLTRIEALLSR
jgi:hypothetical protein